MSLSPVRRGSAAALLFALLLAAGAVRGETLSRSDYRAHKRQIEADYHADEAGCRRRTGQDRNLCLVQAQGRLNVALAELDYNASGKDADAARLALARSDSDYAVARQRCDALGPRRDRDRCLDQAEAARGQGVGRARTTPLRKY